MKQYLEGCRTDPTFYASAAERMMKAVGEPTYVDTARDQRLGRIFMNRTLKVYPAFKDFYGLEETIERIVGFSGRPRRASKSATGSSISSARSAAASRPWRIG